MKNQPTDGFEPNKEAICNQSTAGNHPPLTHSPVSLSSDVLLQEDYSIIDEECFILAEDYVLLEGEYVVWEDEDTPHRMKKPVNGIRSSFYDEEVFMADEESHPYMAESFI